MPIRWEYGQSFADQVAPGEAVPPPAAAPAKLDVEVTAAAPEGWSHTITIGPYSKSTHNHLVRVRSHLLAEGKTLPATAADLVNDPTSPFVEADTSEQLGGCTVKYDLPTVPPGSKHTVVVVRGFED